jgi:serine/threonine-protein kinase RsbW/stage II sporulation protein AB (anti-sigma F factor)
VCEFADSAGVVDPPLENLRLAVSEAVTNAVIHAYRHDVEVGSVDVVADLGHEELRIVVSDHGAGFAARTDSPGAGLGLMLMKKMADGVDIRPVQPRGTAVHMSFKVG